MSPKQMRPAGDWRYRVHGSAVFYVAELLCGSRGCTWYFAKSAQRVVYPAGERRLVVYKGKYYDLQQASRMKEILDEHLGLGWAVRIGKAVLYSSEDKFRSYPFIDISEPAEIERWLVNAAKERKRLARRKRVQANREGF